MKFFFVIFYLIIAIFSSLTLAHEGHDHIPVSLKKAPELALSAAASYTRKTPPFGGELLEESWRHLPQSAARVYENGRGFYIVRIENEEVAKNLYIRVLLDGTIDGANFDGANFSGKPLLIRE